MNIDKIRENIILKEGIRYFDYTASGLAYKPIEDEILRILQTYSNTHSESNQNANITSEYYEGARKGLKSLLNLSDQFYLMPCGYGSTAAIKKFQEIMGIYIPPASKNRLNLDIKTMQNLPLVIVSPYEHHSNELSFRQGLCEVRRIPLADDGGIDFTALMELLGKNKNREIIASFSISSNVTGIITDYQRLYLTIKMFGGTVALDGAAYIPYANVDCNFFDALFISTHKLLGGVGGCGLLAIKKSLCKNDEPTFAGGGTVTYASRSSQKFSVDKEVLEEGGTPGITQLIRAYLAFQLRNQIGLDFIKEQDTMLDEYFLGEALKISDIKFYGNLDAKRLPVYSFNVEGFSPYDFAGVLSQKYDVQTRAGCACAGPYGHDLLGFEDDQPLKEKPGWVRLGLHYTHTKDDVDYLIGSMKSVISNRDKIRFVKGRYIC